MNIHNVVDSMFRRLVRNARATRMSPGQIKEMVRHEVETSVRSCALVGRESEFERKLLEALADREQRIAEPVEHLRSDVVARVHSTAYSTGESK